MKEIGGYFEFEQLVEQPYYHELINLDRARSSLLYLIRARKIKKVYLPIFLCDCIEQTLQMEKVEIEYYSLDENFLPLLGIIPEAHECVYIVNYYGQLSHRRIEELKERFGKIMLDNTQAFFQEPLPEVDTFYSCRKFFGIPDGSYLATNVKADVEISESSSKDRLEHLVGRMESTGSAYYKKYNDNEEKLDGDNVAKMSKFTQNLLGALPYSEIKKQRTQNARYLHERLKKYNLLRYEVPEGAFAYPLLVKDASKIREELIFKKIYVPILWPNVLSEAEDSTLDYNFAKNILPLPCDQRYTEEDMASICQIIEEFF